MVDEVSPAKEPAAELQKRQASQLLLALIEHGSRPLALVVIGLLVMIWLFSMREPLADLIRQATTVKVGPLEVQLQAAARSADLVRELDALRRLNSDQLQLFLVIGKRRSLITYHGEELTAENLTALKDAGLLEEWRTEATGDFWWKVSERANRLYDIIQNMILAAIWRSAA